MFVIVHASKILNNYASVFACIRAYILLNKYVKLATTNGFSRFYAKKFSARLTRKKTINIFWAVQKNTAPNHVFGC
jgi:hypothetical protein